jgi:hypothetical protein
MLLGELRRTFWIAGGYGGHFDLVDLAGGLDQRPPRDPSCSDYAYPHDAAFHQR